MRTTNRQRVRGPAPTSRRPSDPRRRLLGHGSQGASSIEYGLLIALVAAVICVGLGVTLKSVFADTISCVVAEFQGTAATNPTCAVAANTVPGGSGGGGGGGGSPIPASPSPTPTPVP